MAPDLLFLCNCRLLRGKAGTRARTHTYTQTLRRCVWLRSVAAPSGSKACTHTRTEQTLSAASILSNQQTKDPPDDHISCQPSSDFFLYTSYPTSLC